MQIQFFIGEIAKKQLFPLGKRPFPGERLPGFTSWVLPGLVIINANFSSGNDILLSEVQPFSEGKVHTGNGLFIRRSTKDEE